MVTYPKHNFSNDLSLATDSSPNMSIQLKKFSLFSEYTCVTVNVNKCCITGALWSKGTALSLANRFLLASRLQNHFVNVNSYNSPIPFIDTSDSYRVFGVELSSPYFHQTMARTKTHDYIPHHRPFHLLANKIPQNPSHPRTPHRQALHPSA
jgi:hypothetical protein